MDEYNNFIEFNKNNKNLLNVLKKYHKINCRNELDAGYVEISLNKSDIGFSFYDKEIPIAFVCIKKENETKLHIMLICSIKNNNNLGSKLLKKVFEYAKKNGYKMITLECDNKLVNFYKKFNFNVFKKLEMDFVDMVKIIE